MDRCGKTAIRKFGQLCLMRAKRKKNTTYITGSQPRGILPPRDAWPCLKTVLIVTAARGCYWHLVGRGQRRCSTFYHAQDTPTTEDDPAQNANSAKAKKP